MSDSYSGRPADDPDGESAALDQEHRDQLAEAALAAGDPAWCRVHGRRHVRPGPEEVTIPAGAFLVQQRYPRQPRIALLDPVCGHELLVLTINGGKLCASYDEGDLDVGARALVERMLALRLVDVDISTNEPLSHEAHTFECAHGACGSSATTAAGPVGPWRQLVDLGWRRNGEGAWQCPAGHENPVG